MTAATNAETPSEGRRGFALPSAYTILFILIVITAIATWIIPAGAYDLDPDGQPIPGTYHQVDPNPQRIVVDSLMAPINGLYGIEGEDGSISVWNSGDLFGAIDVALFILVIGGFLGVTMKTGAIQGGIAQIVARLKGREGLLIPILMIVFAIGGSTFGMAEESLAFYALDDHGDDRGRLRLAGRRVDAPARLRHRRPRFDDQPVRDRHRLGLRRRVDRGRHRRAPHHPRRRHGHRDLLRHALRRAGQGRPRPSRSWPITKAANEAQFGTATDDSATDASLSGAQRGGPAAVRPGLRRDDLRRHPVGGPRHRRCRHCGGGSPR